MIDAVFFFWQLIIRTWFEIKAACVWVWENLGWIVALIAFGILLVSLVSYV